MLSVTLVIIKVVKYNDKYFFNHVKILCYTAIVDIDASVYQTLMVFLVPICIMILSVLSNVLHIKSDGLNKAY